eukprot:TRINITY_DN4520_c0_g1_i1.p1 TRINITY_DN4520_c0_g1~~TRINITY_DN4520_c0_g1_i1.p1  ORF type:complete len:685 (+),score=120.89 TRINITY_DN4520_c0_g1_i1:128-2182(+)
MLRIKWCGRKLAAQSMLLHSTTLPFLKPSFKFCNPIRRRRIAKEFRIGASGNNSRRWFVSAVSAQTARETAETSHQRRKPRLRKATVEGEIPQGRPKQKSNKPKGASATAKTTDLLSKEKPIQRVDDKPDNSSGTGLITVEGSTVKLGSVVLPVSVDWVLKARKKKRNSPEGLFKFALDTCSKNGDLITALQLFDKALEDKSVNFIQDHYNVLLYLCSSAAMGILRPRNTRPAADENGSVNEDNGLGTLQNEGNVDEGLKKLGLERGFEIYQHMLKQENVVPNEATFTSVARLGVAKQDGDLAFEMVKQMMAYGISPRLRSYDPALYAFCQQKKVEKAYEVDAHMLENGIQPEEPELKALLKLSVDAGVDDKVYSLIHRVRSSVRQVSESTANVIENWFKSKRASEVGARVWDVGKIREASVSRGGGWHGQGWLGEGEWNVVYTNVTSKGVCVCCGERLATIDLDPSETERFAQSIASLAFQRENRSHFSEFQKWLEEHGPYEAILDGANIGLHQSGGSNTFSFRQLDAVSTGLQRRSPSNKLPLIVLHNMRTKVGPAKSPANKERIMKWGKAKALYATPNGSNDDWYWLYAAVRFKCLIVTNDEMRDHLFQLLGNDFFPTWKERHQVRYSLSKNRVFFHMPPPFSIVIQEAENGSWHVPIVGGDDIEVPRKWLCATRTNHVKH